MSNQLSIRYPPPVTPVTFEGSLINCVRQQMFGEMARLRCSVITLVTFKRSFPGMFSPNVNSQSTFLRETVITHLTEEWSLPRVFSCMNNQVLIRYPSPITRITFKRSISCVCHRSAAA